MSRIGLKPISVPAGVEVTIADGNVVTVKGPKGTLTKSYNKDMIIKFENGEVTVARPSEDKLHKSLHGLTRTLIANMIEGVTNGFSKTLEIVGVGYRVEMKGKDLNIALFILNDAYIGFSHRISSQILFKANRFWQPIPSALPQTPVSRSRRPAAGWQPPIVRPPAAHTPPPTGQRIPSGAQTHA